MAPTRKSRVRNGVRELKRFFWNLPEGVESGLLGKTRLSVGEREQKQLPASAWPLPWTPSLSPIYLAFH